MLAASDFNVAGNGSSGDDVVDDDDMSEDEDDVMSDDDVTAEAACCSSLRWANSGVLSSPELKFPKPVFKEHGACLCPFSA
jgi:hypothetical protein